MINDINYNKLNLKTIILHAVINKGFVKAKVKVKSVGTLIIKG